MESKQSEEFNMQVTSQKCNECLFSEICGKYKYIQNLGLHISDPKKDAGIQKKFNKILTEIIKNKGGCKAKCAVACVISCPLSNENAGEKKCTYANPEQRYKLAVKKCLEKKIKIEPVKIIDPNNDK
jgi:hypothetical protein